MICDLRPRLSIFNHNGKAGYMPHLTPATTTSTEMADKLICVSQHQALLDKWGTNDKINNLKNKYIYMANIYGKVLPGGIVR